MKIRKSSLVLIVSLLLLAFAAHYKLKAVYKAHIEKTAAENESPERGAGKMLPAAAIFFLLTD
ncbi:MAG: hypothetical protein KIT80_21875 [Chitinophagaceae bacterium]|nr:hypothetical protein [Chitinophagaceae bacterium]MCW5929585.1 hypothetical protein [Chitinophagaceae bacterium]